MIATLHLPGAAPRLLTAAEMETFRIRPSESGLLFDFEAAAPALRQLWGTEIPGELIASGGDSLIIGVENAADYGFAATPSASADFERLSGMAPEEDEPLVGPLLIIEA